MTTNYQHDLAVERSLRLQAEQRIATLEAEVERLRAENAGLAQWQCATCGARFPKEENPVLLDGVTQCSRCVECEILGRQADSLRADLAACAAGPWKPIAEYDGDDYQMILQRWRDSTTVLGLYGLRSEAVTHYAELREGPHT